jgi:hypothetical protein
MLQIKKNSFYPVKSLSDKHNYKRQKKNKRFSLLTIELAHSVFLSFLMQLRN